MQFATLVRDDAEYIWQLEHFCGHSDYSIEVHLLVFMWICLFRSYLIQANQRFVNKGIKSLSDESTVQHSGTFSHQ